MARVREEFGTEFEVAWHPYFLSVNLPKSGPSKRESYSKKGLSDHQMARMERKMTKLFADEGLAYTLDGPIGNTMDSHRLASWAFTKYGAATQDKLIDVIFRNYFSEQGNPADHGILLSAAEEVGIDVDSAKALLETDAGTQSVLQNAQDIMNVETVTGVPHYFVSVEGSKTDDNPRGVATQIPGAQDTETFYLVIRQLVQKFEKQVGDAKL